MKRNCVIDAVLLTCFSGDSSHFVQTQAANRRSVCRKLLSGIPEYKVKVSHAKIESTCLHRVSAA